VYYIEKLWITAVDTADILAKNKRKRRCDKNFLTRKRKNKEKENIKVACSH